MHYSGILLCYPAERHCFVVEAEFSCYSVVETNCHYSGEAGERAGVQLQDFAIWCGTTGVQPGWFPFWWQAPQVQLVLYNGSAL